MDRVGPGADWRDAAAYAPFLGADRSIFAWEWLRRDPLYREAAELALAHGGQAGDHPEVWGLHAFEAPNLAAPQARPVWRRSVHPFVLPAEAGVPAAESDAFALERFALLATIVPALDGGEHLLISDGLRMIRIDVRVGSVAAGPVELCYRLAGCASAERPLMTLRRMLALWRTGTFALSLHRGEAKARRWILALRIHDALATGAGQREIAAALLSEAAAEARWRINAASVRSQVQRLVRSARRMAAGGYRELLR